MSAARCADPQLNEPAFAPAVLEAMFGDAPGVIAAVLETFCTSMGEQLPRLQAASVAGDIVSMRLIAHRIKGAAGMSGALALARAAERLEFAARDAHLGARTDWDAGAASDAVMQQWMQLPGNPAFRQARRIG